MASLFDPKKYWNDRLIWSYKVTRYRLKKIFRQYIRNNGDVLDIGSGTGFVIDIFNQFDLNVCGIDISETAVKRLGVKFPKHKFYEIDAGFETLPFEDDVFQLVTASSVLYHLIEDDSLNFLLKEVHRVLRPGSYFIFSDNFIHGDNLNITHQKCRSLEDYEKALESSGFEIVDRVANYVLFNDPVDARGKFYPRIWNLLTKFSKKWKLFDFVIWPCLFPIEILLTSLVKESPAQEIMICKVIK